MKILIANLATREDFCSLICNHIRVSIAVKCKWRRFLNAAIITKDNFTGYIPFITRGGYRPTYVLAEIEIQ